MSDPRTEFTDSAPSLAGLIAGVVITTPGVVRLEPTRDNVLRQVSSTHVARARGTEVDHTDGVVVRTSADPGRDGGTTIAGTAAEVTVDIAIITPPTAIEVAVGVRDRIEQVLADHGLTSRALRVNILSIEDADPVVVRLDR